MKKILFLVSLLALFVLSCGAKTSKDKNVIKGEFHVKSFKRKFIIFRS